MWRERPEVWSLVVLRPHRPWAQEPPAQHGLRCTAVGSVSSVCREGPLSLSPGVTVRPPLPPVPRHPPIPSLSGLFIKGQYVLINSPSSSVDLLSLLLFHFYSFLLHIVSSFYFFSYHSTFFFLWYRVPVLWYFFLLYTLLNFFLAGLHYQLYFLVSFRCLSSSESCLLTLFPLSFSFPVLHSCCGPRKVACLPPVHTPLVCYTSHVMFPTC